MLILRYTQDEMRRKAELLRAVAKDPARLGMNQLRGIINELAHILEWEVMRQTVEAQFHREPKMPGRPKKWTNSALLALREYASEIRAQLRQRSGRTPTDRLVCDEMVKAALPGANQYSRRPFVRRTTKLLARANQLKTN